MTESTVLGTKEIADCITNLAEAASTNPHILNGRPMTRPESV